MYIVYYLFIFKKITVHIYFQIHFKHFIFVVNSFFSIVTQVYVIINKMRSAQLLP